MQIYWIFQQLPTLIVAKEKIEATIQEQDAHMLKYDWDGLIIDVLTTSISKQKAAVYNVPEHSVSSSTDEWIGRSFFSCF